MLGRSMSIFPRRRAQHRRGTAACLRSSASQVRGLAELIADDATVQALTAMPPDAVIHASIMREATAMPLTRRSPFRDCSCAWAALRRGVTTRCEAGLGNLPCASSVSRAARSRTLRARDRQAGWHAQAAHADARQHFDDGALDVSRSGSRAASRPRACVMLAKCWRRDACSSRQPHDLVRHC